MSESGRNPPCPCGSAGDSASARLVSRRSGSTASSELGKLAFEVNPLFDSDHSIASTVMGQLIKEGSLPAAVDARFGDATIKYNPVHFDWARMEREPCEQFCGRHGALSEASSRSSAGADAHLRCTGRGDFSIRGLGVICRGGDGHRV